MSHGKNTLETIVTQIEAAAKSKAREETAQSDPDQHKQVRYHKKWEKHEQ